MTDPYVLQWARAFALTVAIELLVATPLLPRRTRLWRRAALVFFAQLASHPLVWFVWVEVPIAWSGRVAIAEAWAFASEAVFYVVAFPRVRLWRAALVSLLANGASFGAGKLLEPFLY